MQTSAFIARLAVVHRAAPEGTRASAAAGDDYPDRRIWRIDTCMRSVRVGLPDDIAHMPGSGQRADGIGAYRLLLEITTGLRSRIVGETNVDGQFRHAWRSFCASGDTDVVTALAPVVQRLRHDTRAIRRGWLNGIGGNSYGSLTRRLLGAHRDEHILFVGSGRLMQSMLPMFRRHPVGVWTRGGIRPIDGVERRFRAGREAAAWADHVIITTPADPTNDHNWHGWLRDGGARTAVHLGVPDTDALGWNLHADIYAMNDLFALQRRQDDKRIARLDSARDECARRARWPALHATG